MRLSLYKLLAEIATEAQQRAEKENNEKRIREAIDAALDNRDKEMFFKLTRELEDLYK
jgi:uncharacterized protein YpiB (UPF0302 family)